MINCDRNINARLKDVSATGAAFVFDGEIDLGDEIIAYLDGGARFVGPVVRIYEGGFAIELAMSKQKRDRLKGSLDQVSESGEALRGENLIQHRAPRVSGMGKFVSCETPDGQVDGRIVDMSLSGVGVELEEPLALRTAVVVGKMRGIVVRRDGKVHGVQFVGAQPQTKSQAFERTIGSKKVISG